MQHGCINFDIMGVLRKTKNLEDVLETFRHSRQALSANMLLEQLSEGINKSTVYRLLDRLEDDGVIHSFLAANHTKFYALCQSCTSDKHVHSHPHFQCLSCNQVVCLEEEFKLPSINDMNILEAEVFLKGYCASCQF